MPKKGEFHPYRLRFEYPNGIHGVIVVRDNPDSLRREALKLLRRGATVEIRLVNRATRKQSSVRTMTPADLPPEPDEDRG
jgi:hypothetical protein